MKLLTNPRQFEKTFLNLLNKYQEYYWLTAWASAKSLAFKKLKSNKSKIGKIIVGIHFYQTDPNFIDCFKKHSKVKFIKQPSGVFHPKLYIFYNNDNDWKIIIGSANFTNAVFNFNTEISILIESSDINSLKILEDSFKMVGNHFSEATYFSDDELENYKITFKNLKRKRQSLSGSYGNENNKKIKPIYNIKIVNMNWDKFLEEVNNKGIHSLDSRIGVLETSRKLFESVNSFKDLEDEERRFIAGIPNKLIVENHIDWAFFGSMKGSGNFQNRIINNDINISNALDEIPLNGQITENHYTNFIKNFSITFPGNFIGTASRLLAMKRPDVFLCLSSKNKDKLCEAFQIKKNINYNEYWKLIISRIYDCNWWQNPNPNINIKNEISIMNGRAAFLDSIFYIE